MSLDVKSAFKIIKDTELSGEDYNVLSQLYLPIMGIDSFSLYLYIYSLKDTESYMFKKLIDALNLNTPKFLERAFSKLEALSLIKLYYNEHKGYIISLNQPVCRSAYFDNVLLSSFLFNQIGEVEYNKLSKSQTQNPRGYKDITKTFDEVFEIKEHNVENLYNKIFKIKTKSEIKIDNPNFDYIFFKMNFDTDFLDSKVLDDEEFMNQIISISYTYQLNEEEMKEVIMNTIEIDKDLKYQDISKNARKYYQKKKGNTTRVIVTKEPDAFIDSALDDEIYALLAQVEEMDPVTLLSSLNGGIKPSVSEIGIIESLQRDTSFPQSVINLMILMVNGQKEGELPGYNYFQKIANTWARAGIQTPIDALKYIEKQNQKRNAKADSKPTYSKNKKEAPVPEWYQDYIKELDNLPKREKMSQDEIDKILAEAKEKL
ncbi:MAG: DnaD domain protein [Bacilli bacterium]|nr:DnaD domain protein [Bacilli bacterium]